MDQAAKEKKQSIQGQMTLCDFVTEEQKEKIISKIVDDKVPQDVDKMFDK